MLALLTILNKASGPYWNTLKKQLAQEKVQPLTITVAPSLVAHPISILVLILLGMFALPTQGAFYLFWFGMIIISAIVSIFTILGLLETKFFTTQVIGSLGFVSSSIFAAIFLKENLNSWTILSILLAVMGVILFSWKKHDHSINLFAFDRGMVFTIIAVLLSGLATVLYKFATFHVSGYAQLFTGRFVGDLIGWTTVWLIVLLVVKKNPARDLKLMLEKSHGWVFIIGTTVTTFIDAWLIYSLPVTTISILGTIAFPIMYFISYFKYKEKITPFMWLGTLCIVSSIIIFINFH